MYLRCILIYILLCVETYSWLRPWAEVHIVSAVLGEPKSIWDIRYGILILTWSPSIFGHHTFAGTSMTCVHEFQGLENYLISEVTNAHVCSCRRSEQHVFHMWSKSIACYAMWWSYATGVRIDPHPRLACWAYVVAYKARVKAATSAHMTYRASGNRLSRLGKSRSSDCRLPYVVEPELLTQPNPFS